MEAQKNMDTQTNSYSDKKSGFTKRLGDGIEKVGDKVEHAGFKKLGDVIEQAGDKVEHLGDRRTQKNSAAMDSDKDSSASELGAWTDQVLSKAADFESRVGQFIQKRPIAFLAGALTVGFVANRLISLARTTPQGARK